MEGQKIKLSDFKKHIEFWFGQDTLIKRSTVEAAIIDILAGQKVFIEDDIHTCEKCKYKEPEGSKKYCKLDDDEGSAACFSGDHWTSKEETA
jgi:hypothetical protein